MKKITLAFFSLLSLPALAQWTTVASGTTAKIDAIHFFDANTGLIGGGFMSAKKTIDGGATWSTVSPQQVRDFSFISATTGYSIATVGTIAKTTNAGTTWTAITAPNTNSLWGCAAVDANTAYFCGTGGVMWKTTNGGVSCTTVNTGAAAGDLLTDVYFTSATTGFYLGQSSGIHRTVNSGTTWSTITTTNSLTEMCFPSTNVGYAVGSSGKVFKTSDGGATWTQMPLGLTGTYHLEGVHFFNETTGIAVGLSGKIVYTTDGGVTWNAQASGTTTHLRDVRMLSATSAVVVGDSGLILRNMAISWLSTPTFEKLDWSITPNPTSGLIQLRSNSAIDKLTVCNLNGQPVLEREMIALGETTVDLSGLASGIYLAKIESGDRSETQKIVLD